MVDTNLVGRCGLYCGACTIYRAYKDGGEYLRGRAQRFNCPTEKVQCEGCMALIRDSWGYNCKIVQCLRSKGLDFCYQCAQHIDDSCEKYRDLAKGYLEDGVDLRANLERIKRSEVQEWLDESEREFKCPECGRPLSIGARKSKCYHCGADLTVDHHPKTSF